MAARRVAIVPHTHWDREWYQPFQAFRLRLVDLLDELLPRLEADADAPPFLLDGQLAAVDDYLALRPEAEPRVRRLVAAGRLSVGPCYVLPDEFLVSGETLVRNLQAGLDRAAALGGAMQVGYLPDMFGHVAQMPQLLRLAGFEHAVVWRGVPRAVDRNAFWWSAPDGSTVRAEYLPGGYGNGVAVPDDAKALLTRMRAYVQALGPLLPPGASLLWMNGSDHEPPQPWLRRVVAEADELADDLDLAVTTLPAYLATAPAAGLPSWTGELRSGARANLLMGVASNRVDVKALAARTEQALERLAEPLTALFLPAEGWPETALRAAWTEVIRNAAHDSVCACSADEVVDAVKVRYAEARQVADGLTARALAALAASMADADPVVVNPSARARMGVVELLLAGDEELQGAQVVAGRPGSVSDRVMTGGDLEVVLAQLRNDQLAWGGDIGRVDVVDDATGLDVVVGTGVASPPAGASVLADLTARAAGRRRDRLRLRVEHEPYRRVLVRASVAGFGWQAWRPAPLDVPPAQASGRTMSNGLATIEVDARDGTFSIDGHGGLDLLVDDGDAGDTYNYSPPELDAVVDSPVAVDVRVGETGPVRASLVVTRTFEWLERVVDGVRMGERRVDVTTTLSLCAGERLVRVTSSFDNRCRDHRLRAWLPLPEPAGTTTAECAFGTVERSPASVEGGPHERALPTFPSRRFVTAGGLTVVHEGLLEHELVDVGQARRPGGSEQARRPGGSEQALAITLLRCVGVLSGTDLIYRPMPAGPPLALEGPQLAGPQVLRYAVALGDTNPYALADQAFLPLLAAAGSGRGDRPAAGTALTVEGAEVSAVRRPAPGSGLEVRVFNPSTAPTTVHIPGRTGWLVDLRGRNLQPFQEMFTLRPHGIATARLT